MFKIKTDTKNNTLTLSFIGHFDVQQGAKLCSLFKKEVFKLKKGYKIVTDLSELDLMDLGAAKYIEQIMDICNTSGVKKITRIIPDASKDIGLSIMSLFHYSSNVKIRTLKSIEELKVMEGDTDKAG